jgi:hypothetical protein
MTDTLQQFKPLHETSVPPQVYKGFPMRLPEPLGPDYVQLVKEWKDKKTQEIAIQEQLNRETQEQQEREQKERERNLEKVWKERSQGPKQKKDPSPQPPSSQEELKEVTLTPAVRASRNKDTGIVVVLERDEELPLSTPSAQSNPQPLTMDFSPEQKQQVDDIMLVIHERDPPPPSSFSTVAEVPKVPKPKPLKVPELRDLCKQHSLATDGTKDVLLARLEKNKII